MKRFALVVCATALMVAGCSQSVFVPVSGRVTLDGGPVANATVSFQPTKPVDGKTGTGSFARTDADGRYRLELVTVDVGYGAVVGEHKVTIQIGDDVAAAEAEDQPKSGKIFGRTYTVPDTGTDAANFDLSRPNKGATRP